MATKNYTGTPIRFASPTAQEIPSEGVVEFTALQGGRGSSGPERDVLVLNDGQEVPGIVHDAREQVLQTPWGLKFPTDADVIIVTNDVAAQLEASDVRWDCQVWSPGKPERSADGVVYYPKPIRHKRLTVVYR